MKLSLILILCLALIACTAEEVPQEPVVKEDTWAETQPEIPIIETNFSSEGGGVVEMVTIPDSPLENEGFYDFSWSATGGRRISETSVQYSTTKSFEEFTQSAVMKNGPGVYKGSVQIEGDGNVYVRAYAMIDGEVYYSETLTYEI